MLVRDLFETEIPTLDTDKLINNILAGYANYPKNSLSKREIVESITIDHVSLEDAKKFCDELNAEVTKTILSFHKQKAKKSKR